MPVIVRWICRLLRAPNKDECFAARVLRTFSHNLLKKMSLPVWYAHRAEVVNWFRLYFVCSSLWRDLVQLCVPSSRLATGMLLKVRYSSGLTIYYPHSDYASNFYALWSTVFDQYISDFDRCFGENGPFSNGGTVIDIGAHIGTFSVPLRVCHQDIRVFAFEPDPLNFGSLQRNIAANTSCAGAVVPSQVAVYSHPGELSFAVGDTSTTGVVNDAGVSDGAAENAAITVEAVTLEQIFESNGIESCSLLKMDCVGSEYEICEKASDDTLARIERMVMEIHPMNGRRPTDLMELLERRGFVVKGHERNDGAWEAFCVRKKG